MSELYLFNPENDLALAHGKVQYTAPPNAVRLHNAGALLPLWYCGDGAKVLASSVTDVLWINRIKSLFDIKGSLYSPDCAEEITCCVPWGWSHNAVRQYLDGGVPSGVMPKDDDLERMRQLSHRRISIEVSRRIKDIVSEETPPLAVEAKTVDEVICFANLHQSLFIKSPWSSSGRGVINASTMSEPELRRRANGIIRRQGAVMCEKALENVKDFAMLFYCNDGNVEYCGLSSFFNEGVGTYAGNVIASQQEIEVSLNGYNANIAIGELAEVMPKVLSEVIGSSYRGYLGVDMMLYRNEKGRICVNPCVEVNMRMTMGVVAKLWSDRFLYGDSKGVMRVEYSPGNANEGFGEFEVVDGRLKSGKISLIPPDDYFKITVGVQCCLK